MSENELLESLKVEKLSKGHDRSEFCCGEIQLDNFIKTLASQYEKKGLCRTYVALWQDDKKVIGYYSLSSLSVGFEEIPENAVKSLKNPRMPIPCVLLGRLAVDQSAQGKKLGKYLMLDAFSKALQAAANVGSVFMIVHALHERAKEFYKKFGFREFITNDLHLFLSFKDIRGSKD